MQRSEAILLAQRIKQWNKKIINITPVAPKNESKLTQIMMMGKSIHHMCVYNNLPRLI